MTLEKPTLKAINTQSFQQSSLLPDSGYFYGYNLASDLQFFDRDSLMRLELSVELAGAFPIIGDIERSILKRCNNTLDIVNMISSGNSIFPTNVTDEESFYTSQSSKFFLFNFSSGCRIENSRSVLDVGWKILA
jgi:hypothetical protein